MKLPFLAATRITAPASVNASAIAAPAIANSVVIHPIARTPIRHVITVVMGNQWIDNLFHEFPGLDSTNFSRDHNGNLVQLQPAAFEGNCDPDHSHEALVKEYNGGRMNGFDTTPASCVGPSVNPLAPTQSAADYPHSYRRTPK